VLADGRWRRVADLAQAAKILPVKRAYTYFRRLENLRLLKSAKDAATGKLIFKIDSTRGVQKLDWLRKRALQKPALQD
jgi:hypothetical protein